MPTPDRVEPVEAVTDGRSDPVLLVDGETATVRRLHPSDVGAVLALHTHLSEDSGVGHAAVGCFRERGLIGVAQYEILADPGSAAEAPNARSSS